MNMKERIARKICAARLAQTSDNKSAGHPCVCEISAFETCCSVNLELAGIALAELLTPTPEMKAACERATKGVFQRVFWEHLYPAEIGAANEA